MIVKANKDGGTTVGFSKFSLLEDTGTPILSDHTLTKEDWNDIANGRNFEFDKKTKEYLVGLINAYWRFDNYQQPMSSWHDKQDLIDKIKSLNHE